MEKLVKLFEEVFGEPDADLKVAPTIYICSGGYRENDREEMPALYLTEKAANQAWFDCADDFFFGAKYRWKWVDKPELRKIHITTTDSKHQERVASMRWAVTAQIMYSVVEGSEDETKQEEIQSAA